MSAEIVDLSNIREVTDGDQELEQELFNEFIESSEKLLSDLEEHGLNTNDNEAWRKAAHALKGMALNLGANQLGSLYKDAQDNCEHDQGSKQTMLRDIKEEHQKVVAFLKAI